MWLVAWDRGSRVACGPALSVPMAYDVLIVHQ